jgi:hypothetical protein
MDTTMTFQAFQALPLDDRLEVLFQQTVPMIGGKDVDSVTPRYSEEEFARRGDALYENVVRPQLKKKDKGKFVAIDIETGSYVVDGNQLRALDRLHARVPGAQPWLVRVGSPYVHRFGRHQLRGRT